MLTVSDQVLREEDGMAPTYAESPLASTEKGWYALCRGAVEMLLAVVLLIVTAPLLLLAMLATKLTSRGPVIYSQRRVGLMDRTFTIYKIRTMLHDCEALTGPRWSTTGDPRITPVGRFLRRTHIDELPQLWNILRGEMSLVGPRPERPEIIPQLEKAIPGYRGRLAVRPGVTGLAQVQLPPDTDLTSVRKKLAYDLYYVRNIGPILDLKILLGTGFHVVGCPAAVTRKLLLLPSRERVEGHSKQVCGERGELAGVQTA